MYWLTMEKHEYARLWYKKPIYFEAEDQWSRPGGQIANSGFDMGWPALQSIAHALGLTPGAEGILEITLDLKAAPADSTAVAGD